MKKFAALLLTLVMVLSLAACGSKTETPAKEEAPAQAETQEPAAEAGFTTVEDGKLKLHRLPPEPALTGARLPEEPVAEE